MLVTFIPISFDGEVSLEKLAAMGVCIINSNQNSMDIVNTHCEYCKVIRSDIKKAEIVGKQKRITLYPGDKLHFGQIGEFASIGVIAKNNDKEKPKEIIQPPTVQSNGDSNKQKQRCYRRPVYRRSSPR